MSIKSDYTFIVPAYHYPLAEICVSLIRYFYPDNEIIITFDANKFIEKRKLFFSTRFDNITFVPDKFVQGHARQLNRMIYDHVKTKYFVSIDDDSFMFSPNLLEIIDNSIEDSKGAIFIDSSLSHLYSQRILPYFCVFETETFKEYNMTFNSAKIGGSGKVSPNEYYYYDVGSFMLFDVIKNQIPVLILNNIPFFCVQHLWYVSDLYRYLNKNAFSNHDFESIIPLFFNHFDLQNLKMFETHNFANYEDYSNQLRKRVMQINHYAKVAQKIIELKSVYPQNFDSLFAVDEKKKNTMQIPSVVKINPDFKIQNRLFWADNNIGWSVSFKRNPLKLGSTQKKRKFTKI